MTGDTGLPLSEVSITAADITGEIRTDSQGFFSFPVSEFLPHIPAKEVLLTAEKQGFTYAQRKVVVRSRVDVIVDNIYLVPRDTLTTTITPEGGVATNSGSNIILEFPAGAVDAPIEVNITEFDSSKELPTPLPETSHFTFAADFLPDGTVFNQPVHLKVENFLGFPPGIPVPVGYYDKNIGAWKADGVGIISDDGLWMEYDITHFSPYDLNWSGICLAGGCAPAPDGGDDGDDGGCGKNMCCEDGGSGGGFGGGGERDSTNVGKRDGSFETGHSTAGYTVNGQGFNMTLRYNSKHANPQVFIGRTSDFSDLPYLPDSLRADIDFMGMRKTGFFQPSYNELSFRAIFEPEDIRGNDLSTGFYPYVITLTNRYDTLYYTLTEEFGGYGSTVFSIPAREPKYVSRSFYREAFIRNDKDSHLAKGWNIAGIRKLIKSSNGRLTVIDGDAFEIFGGGDYGVSGDNIISTIAGGGSGGDGGPATEAIIGSPSNVILDKQGNIYLTDENRRVRKISTDGIITTVAGTMFRDYGGDGGPATEAKLHTPKGMAVDSTGNLYIADSGNHRIRKVDTNGIITTIAGTGQRGYNGDGIPADEATLNWPDGLVLDNAGNIYFSDSQNYRVRKISVNGIISTIAGNVGGYSGDGGPAIDANFVKPEDLAIDSIGNIYITDSFIHCVRKIDTDGIINTFAGFCNFFHAGNEGDGGPATSASLETPRGVAVDQTNNLYISDFTSHRIRKVNADGIISTLTNPDVLGGSAGGGFSGDGGPASEALLKFPTGVTVDSAGNVYISDTANDRIRKVSVLNENASDGTVFKSAKNNGSTLKINSENTYTMTHDDGFTVEFSSEGLQTSVKDRNGNITEYVYDVDEKLVQVIDPEGGITTFSYLNGYLSSITDPQARTTLFNTDTNGDLVSITGPDGNVTSYVYDSKHSMLSRTLPGNKTYSYTYDSYGMVSEVSLPDGNTKQYTHSMGMGLLNDITSTEASPALQVITDTLLDEIVDEAGNITKYRTNRHGMSTLKIDAIGKITQTERDINSLPLTITQPDGSVIQKTYDEIGNLLTDTDALGNITTYTYEPGFNQIETITDPEGNVTTFSHDANGNLVNTTDALGNVTTMAYDIKGLLLTSTDANGSTIQYQYDANGNLIKTIGQLGSETTYTKDTAGNITSVTDAEGNTTFNEYDVMNRLTKVTDASGGVTSYTYTSGGCPSGCGGGTTGDLLESITDANGNTTSFEYDERDRQTKIINPDSTFVTKTYNSRGNLIAQTDENGNITQYAYDAVNRLLSVTDPQAGVTGYSYDLLDSLMSVSDSNSNTTTYEYDSAKRLLKTISPDTGTTTYSYDDNGNLITKTDANSVTVTYTYDSLNRIISISYPDPSDNVNYTYETCINGKGRLCQMSDASGTTSYEYSKRGQTVKETKVIDGITFVIEYGYSPNGNLENIIYPDGRAVEYTYITNRIDSVDTTKAGITKTIVSDITYDSASLPLAISYGNGILTDMSYDSRNRLSSLNIGALKQLSYTRDNTGNITAILDNLNPAKDKFYTYDNLYRLTDATGPWGNLDYGYDSVGNRQTETTDTGLTNYSYNANKLTSSTGEKSFMFSYDFNGNTTDENNRQYIYNQNQRLIEAIENGITVGEYVYNGNNQRIKKIANGQTTIFHYSLDGQLISESDDTGLITSEYVYLYGQPLAKIEGNNIFYYHTDHLGTPMLMTDESGNVVWEGEYLPFGEELSITGTIMNNLGFPGQYYDSETGLHYNYYRDYKPELGRYIEADPIGLNGGINLYSYVDSNPVNYIDPTGEIPRNPGWWIKLIKGVCKCKDYKKFIHKDSIWPECNNCCQALIKLLPGCKYIGKDKCTSICWLAICLKQEEKKEKK